jgi:hypothetical protein
MNVDVTVLALVGLLDIFLIVYLRRCRAQYRRMDRMARSLQLHLRTTLAPESAVVPWRRAG